MMIQHIRWQALIALVGSLLLLTMLGYLSTRLQTVVIPQDGGSYIEGVPSRPSNLNPLFLQTRADRDLAALLFRALVRVGAGGELLPDLARKWEVSEDGKHYTFYLNEDVLWHDGFPFTAEDVAYTVSVIQDPAYPGEPAMAELWRNVGVEVLSPHTIRFTLPDDLVPFAPFLSFNTFGILPHHLLESIPVVDLPHAPFSRQPIGTGPWRVVQVDGERIVLEPHLPHYKRNEPMLDRLVLRFYQDEASTLEAYKEGEIMGIGQLRPQDVPGVLADPSLNLFPTPISGYSAFFFNLKRPLFQERVLREALVLGVDRQMLIDQVLDGQGVVAHSFLLENHWAYNPQIPRYPYDLQDATRLLDEAGWVDEDGDGIREKDGSPLQFKILVDNGNDELVEVVNLLARQWARLGVLAEPHVVSSAGLAERLRSREFDLIVLSTPMGRLPADPDFYPLWHSSQADEGGQNYSSFANEEADRLLVEARRTLDQESRRSLYYQFQEILARELPALPLYYPIYNYAVGTAVKNVQLGPMNRPADRFQTLPDWYIRTRRLPVDSTESTPIISP